MKFVQFEGEGHYNNFIDNVQVFLLKRCPDNSPRGKLPPVRVRVWVRVRVGGQLSSGGNCPGTT